MEPAEIGYFLGSIVRLIGVALLGYFLWKWLTKSNNKRKL
jgi:hypothetical protein